MQLLDFQATLGAAICRSRPLPAGRESAQLAALLSSDGFDFTGTVQRSWCAGRLSLLARHTLAALPAERRVALIGAWVDRGGGRDTFGAEEAIAFLDFLASHLSDDAEALHWCRIERAIHRATRVRDTFVRPAWPGDAAARLCRGAFASLVSPRRTGQSCESSLFFAPGLPGLVRDAGSIECAVWKALAFARPIGALQRVAPMTTLKAMLAEGVIALWPA